MTRAPKLRPDNPEPPLVVRCKVHAAADEITRPDVRADFTFDDRTRLRSMALDFALRAAGVLRGSPASGAEILAEAEHIERWLAAPKEPV